MSTFFSFLLARKISVRCAGSVKGAVLHAAERTLDGFCAPHYTSSASKKEKPFCSSVPLFDSYRQRAFHPHSDMDSYGPVHFDILASAATLTTDLQRKNNTLWKPGRARSHSYPASTIRKTAESARPKPA